MPEITEEQYAMKFCMLIILDKDKTSGMKKYTEEMKYILESYSKILKSHPGMVLIDESSIHELDKDRSQAKMLATLCRGRNIDVVLRQKKMQQSSLFALLVEAIYRTLVLVQYYAPEGDLLTEIIKETYCSDKERIDTQLSSELSISRATYYRRKKEALMYTGYLFFEAVLPEMQGKI